MRELGIERFRETIFATTKEELTKEGFEKHDKHVGLEAPLTEEEEVLGEVKRKEAEEGRGAGERRNHVSSGVSMPIEEGAKEALSLLGKGGQENLVQLVSLGLSLFVGVGRGADECRKSTSKPKPWNWHPAP